MKGKYSKSVKTAVKLIWSSFDREEIRRGYALLMQAAQQGDADALAFIARASWVRNMCGHRPVSKLTMPTHPS